MLKTIFFLIIVLVIPLFFVGIFLQSRRRRQGFPGERLRAKAECLVEEWAVRRRIVLKLMEALGPVISDQGAALSALRAACEEAEATAGSLGASAAEFIPAQSGPEAGLEDALKRLLPIAQSSPEVRARASLGSLLEELEAAVARVEAARRSWQESESDGAERH